MGWMIRVQIIGGARDFSLFFKMSRPSLGTTQPPTVGSGFHLGGVDGCNTAWA